MRGKAKHNQELIQSNFESAFEMNIKELKLQVGILQSEQTLMKDNSSFSIVGHSSMLTDMNIR